MIKFVDIHCRAEPNLSIFLKEIYFLCYAFVDWLSLADTNIAIPGSWLSVMTVGGTGRRTFHAYQFINIFYFLVFCHFLVHVKRFASYHTRINLQIRWFSSEIARYINLLTYLLKAIDRKAETLTLTEI